jgi:phosphonate transport system ATP-binding protein
MACHAALRPSNFTIPSSIRNEAGAIIGGEVPVIEFLGIGVPDERGGWLLHRVCARFERNELVAVVAARRDTGQAFLDAFGGRRIPIEGRVWADRIPLMRETAARVRGLVTEAGPDARFTEYRSVLWNTLVTPRAALTGLLRFPRRAQRVAALRALASVQLDPRWRDPVGLLTPVERARLAVARGLTRRPRALVLRDVDRMLGPEDAASLLRLVRNLAHLEHVAAVASVASASLAHICADRVIVLADGLLVFDGPAAEFNDAVANRRLRGVVG